MRLNSLLLSMPLVVLLCSPNFTLAQVEVEDDPFKQIQKNENPSGIEKLADDTPVIDPFAPLQQGTGSSTSAEPTRTQTENPFAETPTPVRETKTTDPFGIKPLANGSDTKPVESKPVEQTNVTQETTPETQNPFGITPLANGSDTKPVESKPVEQTNVTQETTPETQNPFGEREPEVQIIEETKAAGSTSETATEPKAMGGTFEEKFWTYLKSNAYENWAPAPNSKGDFYVGSSPHGAFLKMYLNRVAIGNPAELPAGSIIVKENYHVDRSTLKAITVMYRSKAYNPANGDWYWIKFNPDGTVDSTSVESGSKPMAGKVTSCIECHSDAEGDDYTFFNDK